ncbi:MAG: hypothetical protein ACYDAG_14250 [Chloroflexota bacterium]
MGIRPVDLQQVVAKTPDLIRDASAQEQQPLVTQQVFASEQDRRDARRTETVQQFEEAALATIHGRGGRQSRDRRGAGRDGQPAEGKDLPSSPKLPQARIGRNVDIKA